MGFLSETKPGQNGAVLLKIAGYVGSLFVGACSVFVSGLFQEIKSQGRSVLLMEDHLKALPGLQEKVGSLSERMAKVEGFMKIGKLRYKPSRKPAVKSGELAKAKLMEIPDLTKWKADGLLKWHPQTVSYLRKGK